MKCPNCTFDNQKNKNVCENCGSDLRPPEPLPAAAVDPTLTPSAGHTPRPRRSGENRFLRAIGRLIAGIFNFILYVVVILICAAAILFVLVWQCRVNIPIAPNWQIMPKIVANYWNWLDGWQLERCPDLTVDNYFFGDEPVPAFDASGELVFTPECGPATIVFNPQSAPAGTTFKITLDGFMPEETVEACWYFPSTKLENCIDLQTDENGRAETVYFSESSYPKGVYRMEAEDACASVSQEFSIE